MTVKSERERRALERLADAFVDDVLQVSDEEVLAEYAETHGNPAKNATDLRALFEKTLLASNKRRIEAAQAVVATATERTSALTIDITEARQRLHRILADAVHEQLTLAARKESELSDSDVLRMLEDLRELGIGVDDGKVE